MLARADKFYIDGTWVNPASSTAQAIINPASETSLGDLAMGSTADVDAAVRAAKAAFPAYAATTIEQRLGWLEAICEGLEARLEDIAQAITHEMGAPITMSRAYQATSGPQHFREVLRFLPDYKFEEAIGTTKLRHEPIGVCALITPWNWPINQIVIKVAPALAAGCTMVLKPSELSPLDAIILTEVIDASGLPKGVFNLIHGDGENVGAPLVSHPDIDMVSFTGSTRAGVAISKAAASDIKRVSLELGGKSAAIVLDDADFEAAIPSIVQGVMLNSGQSCNARTRVLVPRTRYDEAANIAVNTAKTLKLGDPMDAETFIGPVANKAQYVHTVKMIDIGVKEGAKLLCGGAKAINDTGKGYFIAPTIFGDVNNKMRIAQEEIFGPVLCIIPYDTVEEAIEIANDSDYGLSGAVWSKDHGSASDIANQLRTGMVHLNGAGLDSAAPFGGYKKSGNGREWGQYGLEEFLEVKSIYGANI